MGGIDWGRDMVRVRVRVRITPDSAFAVISAVPAASCPLTLGGHRGRLMREHRGHAVIYAGHTGRTQGGHRGEG